MGECLRQVDDCPVKASKRKSVHHHLFYYRRDYETPLENAFRNAPCNMLERCVCLEVADPHKNPLPKPTLEQMITALTVSFDNGEA